MNTDLFDQYATLDPAEMPDALPDWTSMTPVLLAEIDARAHPMQGHHRLTTVNSPKRRWTGVLVAAAAFAVVMIIGGFVWLISGTGSDVIDEPMPVSSIPDVTVPATPLLDLPGSGLINEVRDLAFAPDGALWIASRNGVVRSDTEASTFAIYGEADGLPASDVDMIAVAIDGTVWAAGRDWIAYYDGTWQALEVELADELAADPLGGVWGVGWGGDSDEAIFRIDRSGVEQTIPFPEGHAGWGGGVDVAVDSVGRFWMVDRFDAHTVFVYEDGDWREVTTSEPLFGGAFFNIVSNVAVASNGTVWVSTVSSSDPEPEGSLAPGVAALRNQTWTTYTTNDGLASDDGRVVIGSDGTVWVIHRNAVSRYDGVGWTVQDIAGWSRSGAVGAGDGTLWLGTDNGVIHVDGTDTTQYAIPDEMAPITASFSLEPMSPTEPIVDAGLFGEVTWQAFATPAGHSVHGSVATAHGFAARSRTSIQASTDGMEWFASEPPLDTRELVASEDDLYGLGEGAVRLAWTGTTWRAVDELAVPEPGPEIRAEPGYLESVERMAFGEGVTVMTARSRVFVSTDGHTYVPVSRGPDPGLLEGAGDPDSWDGSPAGGCEPSWFGGWDGEGSIGPVFATSSGFVAFTSGHPNDWNDFGLCRPVIWTSPDGSVWDLSSAESPFGPDAYIHDIAERDGRFVAVGGQGSNDQGALWVSDDGLVWNEIGAEQIVGSITVALWAVAAGDAGWVALYDGPQARAMYSLDGLSWVVDTVALPGIDWGFGAPDVAIGTDRILVSYGDVVAVGEIHP